MDKDVDGERLSVDGDLVTLACLVASRSQSKVNISF